MSESDGENSRRLHAASALGRVLTDLLTPAARRRGFAQAAILEEWDRMAGPMLAGRCQPVKLGYDRGQTTHGVLFLRARSGAALEIQHASVEIIGRVNEYMGYQAVAFIHIFQAPLPPPAPLPRPRPRPLPDPIVDARLRADVAEIDDPDLRQALHHLGRAIAGSRRRR